MALLFRFVSPLWDDITDHQDLPAVFADLIATAQPFTITALTQQIADQGSTLDDYSAECLTPADRNPSLCCR